jgi:CBS domain-containing protein
MPKIREFMDTVVPTLRPETQIMQAVDFLLHHRVTGAPVVSPDGRMVGIITETDLLKLMTEGIEGEPPTDETVAEYMTTDVLSVSPMVDVYARSSGPLRVSISFGSFGRFLRCLKIARITNAPMRKKRIFR